MYGAHILSKYKNILVNDLQQELHCVGKINHISDISPSSTIDYF